MAEADVNRPQLTVKVDDSTSISTDDGDSIETRAGDGIISIHVDLRMDSPDMFSVEYDMMKLEKLSLIDTFSPGQKVEIAMGLEEDAETLCIGEICYIEPVFDAEAGFRTTISGYHKLHRLTRGQRSTTWGDGLTPEPAATTVAGDVIGKSGANVGSGDDSVTTGEMGEAKVKHLYVPQLNASDFDMLTAMGADLEYKADPESEGEIKFKAPDATSEAVVTVSRERDSEGALLLTGSFRLSTVQQYAAVEVRSWDPVTKKNIVEEIKSSLYNFSGTTGFSQTGKALYASGGAGRKYVVVDQPVNSKDEAKTLAQALFDQFSMDFLSGEVTILGKPAAVPGACIEFTGFGTNYDGKYMITAATHTYRPEEGYRTTIGFTRNSWNGS